MANLASDEACVLVADDNEANRELLSSMLIAEGHKVICAEDGDQALKLTDRHSVNSRQTAMPRAL